MNDDTRASGPHLDPDAEFKRDVIANLARLAQAIENTNERMLEVANEVRRQPCGEHMKWLQTMDERGTKANADVQGRLLEVERKTEAVAAGSKTRPPSVEIKPKTDPAHKAVTQQDLERWQEDSEIRMLSEAERAAAARADQTVEQRFTAYEATQAKMAAALEAQRCKAVEERRGSIRFLADLGKTLIPALLAAGSVGVALRCETKAHPAPIAPAAAGPSVGRDASVFQIGKR